MEIWHDGGLGHSSETLEYFDVIKKKLGKIKKVSIDDKRDFSMEIKCQDDRLVLLSGCGCGYLGTASRASETILKALGVPEKIAKLVCSSGDHWRFMFDIGGKFTKYFMALTTEHVET